MKKETKGLMILAITMLMVTILVPTQSVLAEDDYIEIIRNSTEPTNQDIEITIEAEDILSGVSKIILPDETEVEDDIVEFIATENGTYTFKVVDNAGNETIG